MESIFVSIASYKDSDINNTISDCFKRASHPERVWVGLFLQDTNQITDDFKLWMDGFKWGTHIILKTAEKSLGCGWARNIILNELYNGSDYFLCVDSHSRFLNDWDSKYIQLHSELPTKGVISVFPQRFEFNQSYLEYTETDIPPQIYYPNAPVWTYEFEKPHCMRSATKRYEKVISLSGGNLFGRGEIVDVIKLDEWVFDSTKEQEIYSLLLFKSGYDVYATKDSVIFHKYIQKDDTYREFNNPNVNTISDFVNELKNYGGSERTHFLWLSEYFKDCDECLKTKK